MATDASAASGERHYEESEWEAQKEPFRQCYMERNMTRKQAADHMRDEHGFDATPRQWERRIKFWGFTKYTSREARLQQIEGSGRTVIAISQHGRRPLPFSQTNLHPEMAVEDRNLRRFARREVSRSRSRSRSNSFGRSTQSSVELETQEPLPERAFEDVVFSADFASLQDTMTNSVPDHLQLPLTLTDPGAESRMQIHLFRELDPPVSSIPSEIVVSVSDNLIQPPSSHNGIAEFPQGQEFLNFDQGGPPQPFPFAMPTMDLSDSGFMGMNNTAPTPANGFDSLSDAAWANSEQLQNSAPATQQTFLLSQASTMAEPSLWPDAAMTDLQSQASDLIDYSQAVPALPQLMLNDSLYSQHPLVNQEIVQPNANRSLLPYSEDPLESYCRSSVQSFSSSIQELAGGLMNNFLMTGDKQAFMSNLSNTLHFQGEVLVNEIALEIKNHAISSQRVAQDLGESITRLRGQNMQLRALLQGTDTYTSS